MSLLTEVDERWAKEYKSKGAFFDHDGDPRRPHPLLSGGLHATSYTNSEVVLEDPRLLDSLCRHLVFLLQLSKLDLDQVDQVFGPEKGAIRIAHDVARRIGDAPTRGSRRICLSGYAEKVGEGDQRRMEISRFFIKPGKRILLVEDVLTTGKNFRMTRRAVEDKGGIVLPLLAVLVNSTGKEELDGLKIVELIRRPIETYSPDNCPLCKIGSEPIRPKGVENWNRLNAQYD